MNEYFARKNTKRSSDHYEFIIGNPDHGFHFLRSLLMSDALRNEARDNPDKNYIIVTAKGTFLASKAYLRAIACADDLYDFAVGFNKPNECQHNCPACVACDDFYADFCAHKLQKEPGDVRDNRLLPLCQVLRQVGGDETAEREVPGGGTDDSGRPEDSAQGNGHLD